MTRKNISILTHSILIVFIVLLLIGIIVDNSILVFSSTIIGTMISIIVIVRNERIKNNR